MKGKKVLFWYKEKGRNGEGDALIGKFGVLKNGKAYIEEEGKMRKIKPEIIIEEHEEK